MEHITRLTVFFDGVDQSTVKERCIFTADEEEGLIRFHKIEDGAIVFTAARDRFEEFELRGRVEVRYDGGDLPMHLRGFGV